MRINVYAEEITYKIEVVQKEAEGRTFYGIRFYLKSHPDLHHTATDNDESAITFWVPWTKDNSNDFDYLVGLFEQAAYNLKHLDAESRIKTS